jgi:MoxR-like ATPase
MAQPPDSAQTQEQRVQEFIAAFQSLRGEVRKVIVGHDDVITHVLIGLFAGGHVLLEGVPGLGKTLLIRTLAESLDLTFSRIQFTPDLMPGDIIGTNMIVEDAAGRKHFEFQRGPIFGHILLADEVNRATPKTQSALLEGMQEGSVTVSGTANLLPSPFFVLATQNPIEMEGTYPLPEAQLDRFLLRVRMGYPSESEEERILTTSPDARTLPDAPLPDVPRIDELRRAVGGIGLEHPVRSYIVSLARATREHPELAVGASPRAVEQMGDAARAYALLDGRDYVLPDDVKALTEPVLGHRLVPTTDARIRDRTAEEILREVLRGVAVPTEFREG